MVMIMMLIHMMMLGVKIDTEYDDDIYNVSFWCDNIYIYYTTTIYYGNEQFRGSQTPAIVETTAAKYCEGVKSSNLNYSLLRSRVKDTYSSV